MSAVTARRLMASVLVVVLVGGCGVTEQAEPEPIEATTAPAPTPTVIVVPDRAPSPLPGTGAATDGPTTPPTPPG